MAHKIATDAMFALRSRLLGPRHLAWLLWLALLLPLAQGVAAAHAVSHADFTGERDGKALHISHCDLCLTAAAVTGGALPSQPPALLVDPAPHAMPLAQPVGVMSSAPAWAYRSRAPPFASH